MEKQTEILDINKEKNIDIEEQKIISVYKFAVLSGLTFGLYALWWMYKSWRFFQQKDKSDLMPAVRAVFSIIFLIPLLNRIISFAKRKGYNSNYSSVLLFIGFWVVNFLAILPDPFWLIAIFNFVFLIPPFKALNFARQNSSEFVITEQPAFNGRQIVLIVIGIILWASALLGMIIGEVE